MKRGQQIKIKMSKIEKIKNLNKIKIKPTHEEVKEAVKTLIKWAGDDPDREGLIETPDRVIKAYENFESLSLNGNRSWRITFSVGERMMNEPGFDPGRTCHSRNLTARSFGRKLGDARCAGSS